MVLCCFAKAVTGFRLPSSAPNLSPRLVSLNSRNHKLTVSLGGRLNFSVKTDVANQRRLATPTLIPGLRGKETRLANFTGRGVEQTG